ncbi:MAG: hypothetical protein H6716_27925, partial [Polyangiaceae bacterium]|nr:hypothetical protein [Polyangiaceae bacterium]
MVGDGSPTHRIPPDKEKDMPSSMAPRTLLLCAAGLASSCIPKFIPPTPPEDGGIVVRVVEDAVCSLLTVGNETRQVLSGDHDSGETASLDQVAAWLREMPETTAMRPPAFHVVIETPHGPVEGWLESLHDAEGLVVYFSGLGMYGDGPLAEDFSLAASHQGMASFRVERDADARPYVLDPVLEAQRAVEAATLISTALNLPSRRVYEGVSMGGWEALLAARIDREAAAVVRDPVLAPMAVAAHFDRPGPDPVDQLVAQFFRRMAVERHGEDVRTPFRVFMERVRQGHTDPEADAPERWLCELPLEERERFGIHLSRADPALGKENRAGLAACDFPVTLSTRSGHIP